VKGSKTRCELIKDEEVKGVILIDGDKQVAYRYDPETEQWMNMDYNLALTMTPTLVAEQVETFIESYETATTPSIEIKTIDGKVCTVFGMSAPGVAEKKMWIWQELRVAYSRRDDDSWHNKDRYEKYRIERYTRSHVWTTRGGLNDKRKSGKINY